MGRYIHGQVHVERDAMIRMFKKYWYNPKVGNITRDICKRCVICHKNNQGKSTQVTMSHTGKSEGPLTKKQADFIEMPVCNGLRNVL